MIRTEDLTKFYGDRCVVQGLSISIEKREIVGFLGLNGAGKTTTLRMLAGLLAPSSGRIEIEGRDMLAADAHRMRWRIGFLPERPPVYEDMTVRRYLDFAARLRGYDAERVPARVGEVLEATALVHYADEPITSLSHGYRQRVGIAQAIVHDPALVILDEPTSGLDPVQIVEMRALIRSLKDQHTVLLSSHNLPEISQSCDRLMVIKDGVLAWAGSEEALSAKLGSPTQVVLELVGDNARMEETLHRLETEKTIRGWAKVTTTERSEYRLDIGATPAETIARATHDAGLGLRKLAPVAHELEELFLELTKEAA